ncbi:MAG: 3-deoxy-D-manno-octulosonic acid transferase [Deltaproteobacteria bacterium]|nr:3-deoxy-D-manno-octulosonic acid transferase [Deltaproteobacteria bacterium]
MFFLYDILLHISLILLLPYFIFKMIFAGKYRKGILERFGFIGEGKLRKLSDSRVVWFHAVSVGEVKAVLPLLKHFKEKHMDVKIVFSTVTSTGNAVALKEGFQWIDSLVYFPFDFHWVVSSVVKRIKPKVFVVVEKEIWPNILRLFKKNGVPVMVVNGTISDRSFGRYRLFGFFFNRIFGSISYFLSQIQQDNIRAIALGVEPAKTSVAGNIKFDISHIGWSPAERDVFIRGFNIKNDDKIIVAGSTHAGEEEIILGIFKRLKQEFPSLRLIIAPRHPERFKDVEKLVIEKGLTVIRRTVVTPTSCLPSPTSYDVILLDTIGELSNIYSIAAVAFVGGTLVNIGGHNLLEPAVYKKPVIYGHYLKSYLEMAEMLEAAGGGIRVNNIKDLFEALKKLLADKAYAEKAGSAAYSALEENRGATEKCLKVLESFMVE